MQAAQAAQAAPSVMTGVDPIIEQRFTMRSSEIANRRACLDAPSYGDRALMTIGTGLFRVADLNTDLFVLEAFDDYRGGSPNVRSLTFVDVPEVAGRIAGVASEHFDVITVVPVDQISTIDNYEAIEVVSGPGAKLLIRIFNRGDFAHPMMKIVRLRRALSLAVDRRLLVDALFAGRASVPNGLQLPSSVTSAMPIVPCRHVIRSGQGRNLPGPRTTARSSTIRCCLTSSIRRSREPKSCA